MEDHIIMVCIKINILALLIYETLISDTILQYSISYDTSSKNTLIDFANYFFKLCKLFYTVIERLFPKKITHIHTHTHTHVSHNNQQITSGKPSWY